MLLRQARVNTFRRRGELIGRHGLLRSASRPRYYPGSQLPSLPRRLTRGILRNATGSGAAGVRKGWCSGSRVTDLCGERYRRERTLREAMETTRDGNGTSPPLDVTEITHAVVGSGSLWREVRVVAETGSTNADLLAVAREGAREGVVLAAEAQTAARCRRGRRGAGLACPVRLRPYGVAAGLLGWVPLLTGTAVAAALPAVTAVQPRLKWPNDVLVGDAKLGGILAERSGSAVVAGIGLNVTQRLAELPEGATSLRLEATAAQEGTTPDTAQGTPSDLRTP